MDRDFLLNMLVFSAISAGFDLAKKNAVAKLDAQGNPLIDWSEAQVALSSELANQLAVKTEPGFAIVKGDSN